MRIWISTAIVAMSLAVVAGCGGATSSTAATAAGSARASQGAAATAQGGSYTFPADVCTLLTADDIKAKFGGTYLAADRSEPTAGRTNCVWAPESAAASPGAVTLIVMPVIEDLWRAEQGSPRNVKVDGLGDGAFYSGAAQGALETRAGSTILRFSVKRGSLSQVDADAGVLALARLAFSRL